MRPVSVTYLPTHRDQNAVAAIAQAVLDVDAGRAPGWRLEPWGIGHLRASGRAHGTVVRTVVQRTGPTVWAVALYRRGGQTRAMTLTVRGGRVLHVEMLEDSKGLSWAPPSALDRLRAGVRMTAPASYFGGNSDGAMAMENWLDEMCKGCRHGHIEAGLRGMGCVLPANAYAAPHDDIPEWTVETDDEFGEPYLTCTAKQVRTRGTKRPPTVGASHPTLDLDGAA